MALKVVVLVDNFASEPNGMLAEYGLSLMISMDGLDVLYDTGSTGVPLIKNAEALRLDLRAVSYLFLSHRHSDHTGGVPRLLDSRGGEGLTMIAHPDLYEPSVVRSGDGLREIGTPFSDGALASKGVRRLLVREPLEIARDVWISGEIPRRWPSQVDGMYRVVDGRLVSDDVRDDMAMYIVEGDGFIAITGCGHSGVENIVEHGERLLNRRAIGLVGGLHLMRSDDKRLEDVASYLSSKGLEFVIPLHCTGPRAHWMLSERLGPAYRLSGVGDTITL